MRFDPAKRTPSSDVLRCPTPPLPPPTSLAGATAPDVPTVLCRPSRPELARHPRPAAAEECRRDARLREVAVQERSSI